MAFLHSRYSCLRVRVEGWEEDLALELEQVGILTMPHCASEIAPCCLPFHSTHIHNFGVPLGV